MRPVIDIVATGTTIRRLRKQCGITVSQIQDYLELQSPRAVYKWQRGDALPDVENLLGLSIIFGVSMNDIVKTA